MGHMKDIYTMLQEAERLRSQPPEAVDLRDIIRSVYDQRNEFWPDPSEATEV